MAQPSQNQDPRHGWRSSSPPIDGNLVQMRRAAAPYVPDTVEAVEAQTETVLLNYMYQSYHNETMREEASNIPVAPELVNFPANHRSPHAAIGRQLATMGDDVNARYSDVFDGIIDDLNLLQSEEAYQAFYAIARSVFSSGINWGRIIVLLGLGYRMAMRVLLVQAPNFGAFLSRLVSFICQFVISERISNWIAEHGGWRESLNFVSSASSRVFWFVTGLAAVSAFSVIVMHRYFR